jgi:23S rRNA (pseudouridine1915-N3)-methyltransferase
MKIEMIAIGDKMPDWVRTGYQQYASRMPADHAVQLKELKAVVRGKNPSISAIIAEEHKRIISALPARAHVVALDVCGKQWTTVQLAEQMQSWREMAKPVALVIGGADGLSPEMSGLAGQSWSLSKLTMPHYLVRVLLAEQLYRAWSILAGHPYHRA